jgi:hypothetical protein
VGGLKGTLGSKLGGASGIPSTICEVSISNVPTQESFKIGVLLFIKNVVPLPCPDIDPEMANDINNMLASMIYPPYYYVRIVELVFIAFGRPKTTYNDNNNANLGEELERKDGIKERR